MQINENKNSFFTITLNNANNDFILEKLDNGMDLILSSMKVKNYWYKFINKKSNEVVYFLKTEERKRKGQIVKSCESVLPKNIEFKVEALTRFSFQEDLIRIKNNENFKLNHKPILFSEYSANDIKIFDDRKNWYPWQTEIYNYIFNSSNEIREPHPRQIVSIVDKEGNSGKSSFFKYLFYKHPNTIGRLGYGSASQLRSGVVNIGKKAIYIVDLSRSKGREDHESDLLSVLEDIKSGLVTNAMYGSGKTLLMEPPHIIVSSNYTLNYNALSSDRWAVFEITKSNKLKKINPSKSNSIKK